MKKEFSTHWNSSKQPRKQRKYNYNAPLHIRHKFLSAHLSKELRQKYGKRNLPLRTGDEVLIMRGSFKKKKAKVVSIDLKDTFVGLENIQKTKKDGSKVNIPFRPCVLQIVSLTMDDKERVNAANRKAGVAVKEEIKEKKETKEKSTKEKKKNA